MPPPPAPAPAAPLGLSPLSERILRDGEPQIGPAEAGRPTGTHKATVARWMNRGILRNGRRVRLEHIRVGSKLKTSAAAVKRFFAALGDDQGEAEQPAGRTPTPAERRKAAEAAAKELERMGA